MLLWNIILYHEAAASDHNWGPASTQGTQSVSTRLSASAARQTPPLGQKAARRAEMEEFRSEQRDPDPKDNSLI